MIEAVIPVGSASPIAYRNVYEDGDEWVKVRGCEGCSGFCCGNCPQLAPDGLCALHLRGNDLKPIHCIVRPTPNTCKPGCLLVFRCIRGSNIGKYRHLTDRDVRFRDAE